jgi:hypothetical protein
LGSRRFVGEGSLPDYGNTRELHPWDLHGRGRKGVRYNTDPLARKGGGRVQISLHRSWPGEEEINTLGFVRVRRTSGEATQRLSSGFACVLQAIEERKMKKKYASVIHGGGNRSCTTNEVGRESFVYYK